MNKFNDFINLYKTNRKLFNMVILFINAALIVWQILFTFIIPSRINLFILLLLIGALVFQLVKNPWYFDIVWYFYVIK